MSREHWLRELALLARYLGQAIDLAQDNPADENNLRRAEDMARGIALQLAKMREVDKEIVVVPNNRSEAYSN